MDKYEYKLKLEQIKNLIEAKEYKTAAQIADSINWKKVKSVATLCMIGELYEKTRQLEESREILLMAYDRSPVVMNIIYRLTQVAIKLRNLEEAQDYYEEFIEIAPHDNMKYVLKYEIAKAKGASLEELISILEEFKEREYTEEWAFELAYLYHKNGDVEKCVDICDELILWFGEGKYVEKALELKLLYRPLNKLQEDKYRRFRQKQEGIVEVSPYEELMSGEIVRETVKIPRIQSDTGKFNTMNLQAELARSMQQIMDATKQETINDTINNIKKMVGDISYMQSEEAVPEYVQEEQFAEEEFGGIAPEEEAESIETKIPEAALDIDFKGILSEEYDGQISLNMPDMPKPNLQITGQMSIEDILAEWEKTKEATRAAIAEAEQRKLESVKTRALQEAETIMEHLNVEEIPVSESAPMPVELAETESSLMVEEASEWETASVIEKTAELEAMPEADGMSELEAASGIEAMSEPEAVSSVDGTSEPGAVSAADGMAELEAVSGTEAMSEPEIVSAADGTFEPGAVSAEEEAESVFQTVVEKEQEGLEEKILRQHRLTQQILEREIREEEMLKQEVTIEEAEEEEPIVNLNEEQKKIFTYFVPISGMEKQLCQALEGARQRKRNNLTSSAGNLMISGGRGSGKTVLATDFIKAYQRLTGRTGGKVGKISASVLNQKKPEDLIQAVEGGYLIIEKAGDLSQESVDQLSDLMEQDTKGLMVILEDENAGIKKALARNSAFAKKFTEKIHVPIFTSDELVEFAKSYAREQNCEIDDMGILALYNSISNIQKLDEATTLTEVKEIMDEAISHANRGGLKKLFGGKRNTENGLVLIKEKDFKE